MHSNPPIVQRHLISRLLLLIWCIWLLGNWFIHSRVESWIGPQTMRWLVLSSLLGIMLIWPALRLTDPTPHQSAWLTIGDLIGLLVIFQVIVVRLLLDWSGGNLVRSSWSLPRAILIDAVVVTYAIIAAMWIDLGRRCGASGRTLAMIGCVGSIFLGSAFVGPHSPGLLAISPIRSLWWLTGSMEFINPSPIAVRLGGLLIVCIVVWSFAARALRKRA